MSPRKELRKAYDLSSEGEDESHTRRDVRQDGEGCVSNKPASDTLDRRWVDWQFEVGSRCTKIVRSTHDA